MMKSSHMRTKSLYVTTTCHLLTTLTFVVRPSPSAQVCVYAQKLANLVLEKTGK